ncbi:hypothetical protein MZG30_19510, partial [Escherichia coli]|nr:hypothetical protein [Escherichia coli]
GPDPRNFNQRVSLGRNDLLIRTFLNSKSSFDLTKDVCNSSEWGLAELKMRHEKMKTQLKKLWLV